jgi:hypothetical protein
MYLWLVSFLNLGPPLEEVDLDVLCPQMDSDLASKGSLLPDVHRHFRNLGVLDVIALQ